MKLQFITTKEYYLLVDRPLKKLFADLSVKKWNGKPAVWDGHLHFAVIIAHLPFNGAPVLEGVPVMVDESRFEEVKNTPVIWLKHPERTCQFILRVHDKDMKPTPHVKIHDGWTHHTVHESQIKAASQKQYTEEDMRRAFEAGMSTEWMGADERKAFPKFLQSLKPVPVDFVPELEHPNLLGSEQKNLEKELKIVNGKIQGIYKY